MKSIVITGSTRGIGRGLAEAFLDLGCAVAVSGRTKQAADEAVARLAANHDAERVLSQPCDVTDRAQVDDLWAKAQARFGRVDIWINNAGVGHPQQDLRLLPPDLTRSLVETNVLGAVYGSQVAVEGMLKQGHGSLYNMEGMGSGGRRMKGLALYGMSKRALAYLTDTLVDETKGTPLIVGALRPGMVITDMIVRQFEGREAEWQRAKRIFSIIADRVETVAPWLARKVLANRKSGVRISWLTPPKMMARFIGAPFRRRNLFGESPSD